MWQRWSIAAVLAAIAIGGCTRDEDRATDSSSVSTSIAPPTVAPTTVATTLSPTTSTTTAPSTTPAPSTSPPTTATPTTTIPTTTSPPTTPPTAPPTPVPPPPIGTGYRVPVDPVEDADWGETHSGYPATDIFLGCGAAIVAPVNGTVLEVRRVNQYDPAVDNPATRGGRSLAMLGDDGVRYYFAHFEQIEDGLEVGSRVGIGDVLGEMGQTGRASACHLHIGISPPCPGKEWAVRRGVIWPYPYLDAWAAGEQLSPAAEVAAWASANPNACTEAINDPFAPDA